MEPEQTTSERSLKDNVMNRIKGEAICPRPKYFYTGRELGVWSLWAASVVIGAFAVAVVTFVLMHHEYELYEATHENFMTFMIEALPYLWLVTFAGMALFAVYNLRHTKHGYRYPVWQILGSSLAFSVVGGVGLHYLGMGYAVDHALGRHMAMYQSEAELDTVRWNNPKEGRMLGQLTRPVEPPETLGSFTDANGTEWKLNIDELSPRERVLLETREQVRLIGVVTDEESKLFYSCGAFPWILNRQPSREEFAETRKNFEDKMHSYEERVESMVGKRDADDMDTTKPQDSPCHDMKPVMRMKYQRGG